MKRGRQVRLFSNPPSRTLPTLMIQVEVLLLLLFLNVYVNVNVNVNVNDLRGVSRGPFIG
jgi:hypothetical protein